MASRLSEESLKAMLDAGQQGLAIKPTLGLELLSPPLIDFDQLLLSDDPEVAVQALPPQLLFQSLLQRGVEDCLEVLPLLSTEQVVRILDYDAWREDRLEPLKMIRWLNLFKEVGDEELYRRFRSLDEEYQIGLLNPLIEMFDSDEYEDMSDAEQDDLNALPCHTLYYRIKTEDPRVQEFVLGLIEATMGTDVDYAYALIAHASHLPPNEEEEAIARFRRARLEEDGFVSYEESLNCFKAVDPEALRVKWSFELLHQPEGLVPAAASESAFLQRVLQAKPEVWQGQVVADLRQRLAFLGNSLGAATLIEPDDNRGLRTLLEHARSLISLGLDFLAGGQLDAGSEILLKEHPQLLFRTGLSLVRRLAEATLQRLAQHGLPRAEDMRRQLLLDKRGVLELTLDQQLLPLLGLTLTERLKGLCNRFPARPVGMIEEGATAQRTLFAPINSRLQLAELAAAIDGVTGLLYLASLADDDAGAASVPLERRLLTAMAQALVGGEFRSVPLTPAQLEQLSQLSPSQAEARAQELLASIEGTLRLALTVPHQSWAVSRSAGVAVADPLQAVQVELRELLVQLGVGREFARTQATPSAVASVYSGLIQLAPLPEESFFT